jgi:hypothetical protein
MPGRPRPSLLPALLVLALFLAAALLFALGGDAYPRLRGALGLKPFPPFLDLHNVMAAAECRRLGVDVYALNPCDAMGRVHIYSPLWLRMPAAFADPAMLHPLGIAMALAFAAALAALPWPAATPGRVLLTLAAISPASALALERANMDVAIFALAVAGALLLGRGPAARSLGYGLFLLTGLLKFYPLSLGVLLLRERPRLALALAAASLAILAAATLSLHDEVARALANIPPNDVFIDSFGASQIMLGMARLWPQAPWLALLATGAMAGGAAALAWRLARDPALSEALAALPRREADLLLVGGTLTASCFLAGQNVDYRAILLLPALPALLCLAARGWRIAGAGALAAVLLMWVPLLRRLVARIAPPQDGVPTGPGILAWLLREAGWWFLAAVLAGLVLSLLLRAAMSWRGLTHPAPPRPSSPATEGTQS